MAYRTGDPYGDFSRREYERECLTKRRPHCNVCGERIYGSVGYRVNDELMCPDCFRDVYNEVDMDDFM